YTGVPGSGKTAFGLQLVRHLTNEEPNTHVVWTVHSNELCDDIASKLGQITGSLVSVARIYPMRRMIQALAGRHASNITKSAKTSTLPRTAAGIATAIASHTRQRAHDDPTTRADSLVIRALEIAEVSPRFADIMQLRAKAVLTGNELSALTGSIYRLIATVLKTTNIIVGTPVALSQLGNCSQLVTNESRKWDADVIVVDEAARMPEAQAWIPIATFDTKLVVMMGDTRQFEPVSKSFENQGQ
ncbi:P-loop containing nucleoside triphosphate hydrolase protein, partial [Colletotrichum cereale]